MTSQKLVCKTGNHLMRRAVATGMVLAAFASGCGGGSDVSGSHPATTDRSQGPATTVTPLASDGRLGGAVVARPGETQLKGGVERITPKDVRPQHRPNGGVGAEESCADAELQPTAQNLAQVSDAIFCLMNAMRANAGLPGLAQQDQLAQASVNHSQDMVDQKYFAHDSLDGRDVLARLTNVGYVPKSGDWVIGENLAWGTGTLATPQSLVNAWMNSPAHRENLLAPDYREVGMGVVYGSPSAKADGGVTVTTDFGTRPAPPAPPKPVRPKAKITKKHSTRRARALRRCTRKHGAAKRRCVRAARRLR